MWCVYVSALRLPSLTLAHSARAVFEGGSSAIIFFTAFFYLGALLYALWVLWAMLWKADFSYTGHIAWPIAMFFAGAQ